MTELLVTRDVVDALLADVRYFGARTAETGGFLLSTEREPDRVTMLALGGEAGIVRRRGLFTVSGVAIERLFTWAADHDLRIRAQVHSHAGRAFLSSTDLRHGFDVVGFITAVVPDFADPASEPGRWGWWQRAPAAWLPLRAPIVVAGPIRAFRFDEGGVSAA